MEENYIKIPEKDRYLMREGGSEKKVKAVRGQKESTENLTERERGSRSYYIVYI